jgi:hypothetical protein
MRTATTSTTSAPTRLSSWPGGRLPDSGDDLCSQPTISRWENAPTRHEVAAMSYAMIDLYCASYARPPREVTFDIDDTVDVWHAATLAVQHASRRTLLSADPRV